TEHHGRGDRAAEPASRQPPPTTLFDVVCTRRQVRLARHQGCQRRTDVLRVRLNGIVTHGCPPSAATAADSAARRWAKPRAAWLLTFPVLQPKAAAVCSTDRSSQYLSTTIVRCDGCRSASARRSMSRVPSSAESRPGTSGSSPVVISRRHARLRLARKPLTSMRRTYASTSPLALTRRQRTYSFASASCTRSSARYQSPHSRYAVRRSSPRRADAYSRKP